MNKEIVVLCVRLSDEMCRVDSLDKVYCHECKECVLLAKSTIKTLNESHGGIEGVTLVCVQCSKNLNLKNSEAIPLSQTQIDDIKKFRESK